MDNLSLLKKNGYVTCSGILSSQEVKKAREQLTSIFSSKSTYIGDINQDSKLGNIYIDPFTRYKELRWILFHPNLRASLKNTLGDDFIFVPEMAIHDSGFGGWHKDTTTQEVAGQTFHWDKDFLMVQVGIYLQDNTPEYGGGLDVVPKSHKKRDRFANIVKAGVYEKLRNKLHEMKVARDPNRSFSIPSKAGDVVMFDLRLDHKASWPLCKPIPEEHRKFSIFMVCSASKKHAANYTKFASSAESVGSFWLRKIPKLVIQRCFNGFILLETVRFSHSQFRFVVEALHNP